MSLPRISSVMRLRILLVLASSMFALVLGVLAIEIYTWHTRDRDSNWHDPNTMFDSELGWTPIVDNTVGAYGGVTSNSLGFRSAELDPERKHIAWMGDSVAWGYGVQDNETAAHLLNRLLGVHGFQVQNLGVSGYGLGQYYLYLRKHLKQLPNLTWVVLTIYTGNDLQDTASNSRWGKRKPLFVMNHGRLELHSKDPINKYCLRNIISNSYFLRRHSRRGPFRKYLNYLAGNVVLADTEAKEVSAALLKHISELVENSGANLALVLSPSRDAFRGVNSDRHSWFKQLLTKQGYQYLDMLDINQARGSRPQDLYRDGVHYSNLGNQLYADAVHQFLLEQGDLRIGPSAAS